MNEIFVGVKEIGYIETQISKLCEKYNSRNGVDYIQQRALFRNYCHDTITVFVKSITAGMVLTISSKELCLEIIVMIQSPFSKIALKRQCWACNVV